MTIARNRNLWRFSRTGKEPWWFSSSGGGRFDLSPPLGTCYVALDPLGAVLEVVGRDHIEGIIPESLLQGRVLWKLKHPTTLRAADATNRKATSVGVTRELGDVTPYDLTHDWAAALHTAEFDGIVYWLRHDPAPESKGIAVFGDAGERSDWPSTKSDQMSRLRRQLLAECGFEILDVPSSREVRLID